MMLSHINLDRSKDVPLHRQIYANLREAILHQELTGGLKLPASRQLAEKLGVSRNTVKNAFEQLLAEGYLEAQVGAGTFVSRQLPETIPQATQPIASETRGRPVSQLGEYLETLGHNSIAAYQLDVDSIFLTGAPALDEFPFELWARVMGNVIRNAAAEDYGYGRDGRGYLPLREEIAKHLLRHRAVRCEPEQIVIISGSQMAMHILGQALINRDDPVWLENPGYGGAQAAMRMAQAKLVPVPVDEDGMVVATGIALSPQARAAVVTPSHHFPLGGTMSLARRLQLLAWAEQNNAWIIEDDYDSVFHYNRLPYPSLQGLDRAERVIYLGSFSKVLFPALRLAYLVLPPDLIDVVLGCKLPYEQFAPQLSQAAVAEFMASGHFARHLRRMGKIYRRKRDLLIALLTKNLGTRITIGPAQCGMHLTVQFNQGVQEKVVGEHLRAAGVRPNLVGYASLAALPMQGILLGFASASEGKIKAGVEILTAAIEKATFANC